MLVRERYLVVVALNSGRNFPLRSTYHLICEAKFNNEVLSTDPIQHDVSPHFEQELAWELDKLSLRQHKLQRSAFKVQLFAVDNQSPVKELIGYFMLDLRSCSQEKIYKWYRLLHCKYKNNPAVYASIYLDINGQDIIMDPKIKTGLAMSLTEADLIPRTYDLLEKESEQTKSINNHDKYVWYIIGPKCLAKEQFIFKFNLQEASNLGALIPVEQSLSPEDYTGFYFTYEILGIPIYSKQFNHFMQIKFQSEIKEFYLKSTVDILRIYFAHISPLVVKLYFGSHLLAQTSIPTEHLIRPNNDLSSNAAVISGKFDLIACELNTNSNQEMILSNPHIDNKPYVNLCLSVERYSQGDYSDLIPRTIVRKNKISKSNELLTNVGISKSQSITNLSSNQIMDNVDAYADDIEHSDLSPVNQIDNSIGFNLMNKQSTIEQHNLAVNDIHRYCYTIELRSLKNIQCLNNEIQVYARYVYPIFGSGAPVMTLPPVSVFRNQEVSLPQGFCAFEFAASPEELHQRLAENLLTIEFYDRTQGSLGTDLLIGYCTIDLKQVFDSPISKSSTESVLVRQVSGTVEFTGSQNQTNSNEEQSSKLRGELVYCLRLEDYGLHSLDQAQNQDAIPQILNSKPSNTKYSSPQSDTHSGDLRSTPEYQAAIELELWRAAEETRFMAQLKKREQTLVASLAEEWYKRDSQREMICRKKLSEYQFLEEKLRNVLNELSVRERQLTAGEMELVRLRQENSREMEVKRKEMIQQTQAQVRDLESQLKLEKKQSNYWETQANEWQNKYSSLEQEFISLRSRITRMEENKAVKSNDKKSTMEQPLNFELQAARLETELAMVRATLCETENRLTEMEHSRTRYRQLWTKALHELAHLKQELENEARNSLLKKEAELEELRNNYLNAEEKQQIKGKEIETTDDDKRVSGSNKNPYNSNLCKSNVDEKTEAQITRLIEERDSLLSTGVYSITDPLIIELDRHIRQLLG